MIKALIVNLLLLPVNILGLIFFIIYMLPFALAMLALMLIGNSYRLNGKLQYNFSWFTYSR